VRGPAIADRTGAPPTFDADPGPNRFYALEIAVDADLFDDRVNGGQREPRNFYATWQDGPLLSTARCTIPIDAWVLLRSADVLYYRIATSDVTDGWVNVQATVSAAERSRAPFILVAGSADALVTPDLLVLGRIVYGSDIAMGTRQQLRVHFSVEDSGAFRRVIILPDSVQLDIEEVF
jgi:hypothetical protein